MLRPVLIAAVAGSTIGATSMGAAAGPVPAGVDGARPITVPGTVLPGPQPPDLSAARPEGRSAGDRADAVQAALDKLVRDGAVGAVGRIDTPAVHRGWASGDRRVWTDLPTRTDSAFRVASNTKMMVATLAMQEIQRGTWTLKTTVGQVYPGLLPAPYDKVTVEQLLSHRSGMPDGVSVAIARHMDANTLDAFFEAVGEDYADADIISGALAEPWLFPPGTAYSYSNAGFVVIGQLLQRQNGQSLPDLMQGRVFNKAGMPGSAFPTKPGLRAGSLVGAARVPWRWYSLANFNPEVFSAAGAVVATDKDLNTFTRLLIQGRLTSKATVASMIAPRTEATAYGLGIYRIGDPCRPGQYLYGHDGGTFGTFSFAFSSADGTRQFSLGFSGRYYPKNLTDPPPYDVNDALVALVQATC